MPLLAQVDYFNEVIQRKVTGLMGRKVIAILSALTRANGKVMTKAELMDAVTLPD